MPRGRLLTHALLPLLALAASCATPGSATGPLKVVAGIDVWGDLARQVGGAHVAVTSILTDPSADPHTYQSDPRAAAAVGSARLVIENGLGYDAFLDRLLGAGGGTQRRVLVVADAAHASGNPHLWYRSSYVVQAAVAIAAELARADPAHRADFATGLQRFVGAYQPYVAAVRELRLRHPGTPVAYTERVAGYLVEDAGLRLISPPGFAQSVEDGTDPSAADADAMSRALTGHAARVLLYNPQATTPVTRRVRSQAEAAGVPVVDLAETLPRGQDLQTWQLAQVRALQAALGR